MLGVGQAFPFFQLTAVVSSDLKNAFVECSNDTYKGKWLVAFFWPKDFTFVCPTEIVDFNKLTADFSNCNAQLLGISTDSEFVHLAWREHHPELRNLNFPFLSDIKRELSSALGIIDQKAGVAQRASYIVDPEGIIRFLMVTDLNVGRSAAEVLRVLEALQTGELCPANWRKGENTIKV